MGVRIFVGHEEGTDRGREQAILFCSTTDWAFGPLFDDAEEAQWFLEWLGTDPRSLKDSVLEAKVSQFRRDREAGKIVRDGF